MAAKGVVWAAYMSQDVGGAPGVGFLRHIHEDESEHHGVVEEGVFTCDKCGKTQATENFEKVYDDQSNQ